MSITVTGTKLGSGKFVGGGKKLTLMSLAISGTYETNGFSLADAAGDIGLTDIERVLAMDSVASLGFAAIYDADNRKMKLFRRTPSGSVAAPVYTGTAIAQVKFRLTHSATADSVGRAVYLRSRNGVTGFFTSVTENNASTRFLAETGVGPYGVVYDDDSAATGAVAVYFDEDADGPDGKLYATTPTGQTVYVPMTDGSLIPVYYHASPGTPGVQVYYHDDAFAHNQRFLYISPLTASYVLTKCSTTYRAWGTVPAGTNAAPASFTGTTGTWTEVTNGVNVGSNTLKIAAIGV